MTETVDFVCGECLTHVATDTPRGLERSCCREKALRYQRVQSIARLHPEEAPRDA